VGYLLVGTIGAALQGATAASVTPAWGAGENRDAGHLLVCWVGVVGGGTAASTPSGWSVGLNVVGNLTSSAAAVFYKIAAGGDAAPTIAGISGEFITAQLAEFSGNTATPLDQTGSDAGAASSPLAPVCGAADAGAGELVCVAMAAQYVSAGTETFTDNLNNGMVGQVTDNASTSTANHYHFVWATTTGNSAADSDSIAYTTVNLAGANAIIVSFKVAPVVAAVGTEFADFNGSAFSHIGPRT
jgi:hypothetical protein